MRLFFDTMVFLHYRNMEQLDFNALFGPGPHTVVMPRITLRELDKHKNTHSSSRIRERARRVLKRIEFWTADAEIRAGVSMEFMHGVPTVDYKALGLNPDWADDILIASVLQYKADHPDVGQVTLVTQDSTPRMTASQLGVRVMELPDDHKLPVDPDPLEVENRKLLRTVAALQNTRPKLTVSFAGSEESKQHAVFALPSPPEPMESEIAQKIEELRSKLPKQHPPPPQPKSPAFLRQAQLAGLGYIDPIPADEYERYNRGVDAYLRDYDRYMRDTWELRASKRRSIRFTIEIRNLGTAPAEDVDVLFHFPDGFLLFSEDDLPDVPQEPRPPRKPRSRMQMMTENIDLNSRLDLTRPAFPDFRMPTSFSIERTKSYDVRDHFTRIKHGEKVALPEMFLIFESYETAGSFACDYTIRPANLPSAITGQLHFVIEKADGNKAIDSDEE